MSTLPGNYQQLFVTMGAATSASFELTRPLTRGGQIWLLQVLTVGSSSTVLNVKLGTSNRSWTRPAMSNALGGEGVFVPATASLKLDPIPLLEPDFSGASQTRFTVTISGRAGEAVTYTSCDLFFAVIDSDHPIPLQSQGTLFDRNASRF